MANVERISAKELERRIEAGDDVLLVCAYDDEEKCRGMRLEGALTYSEFRRQRDSLDKNREIVFYCA